MYLGEIPDQEEQACCTTRVSLVGACFRDAERDLDKSHQITVRVGRALSQSVHSLQQESLIGLSASPINNQSTATFCLRLVT